MNERALRPERIRRLTLTGAASLVALSMLLIFFGPSSTAHAQESETPANDCWNGALSSDPLHCYVLEADISQMEFSAFINAPCWDSGDYTTTP